MGSRNKSSENGHSKYGSETLPFISPTLKPQITATKYNVVDHYPVNLAESQERTKKVEQFEHEIIKNGSTFEHGNQEEKKGFRSYFGILLALLAGFVFTVGTVIVVKYMKHYHPFTLAMFRLQGIFVPSILMVFYYNRVKKIPVFQPIWPVTEKGKGKKFFGVVLRASLGCTCLFLHFHALQHITVADVAVLSSCKPVFVTIAAFFLLGESCGIFPVLMALFTMVGVGVITRPPILTGQDAFDNDTLVGAGFAISSVFLDTFVVCIIRYLKVVHVSVMMLFLGFWGTIQSVVCAYSIGELRMPESGTDWGLAIALAAIALINQVAMNLALQFEQAGPVSVTRTMDFIFAFMLQFIWMGIVPDLFSISGAAIIIACVLLIAFRKWLNMQPKTHAARKRYWFVLK